MIYIKNTTETQTIFIPRNELQKEAYVTSTKTYEDGYRDGLEDGKEYQKDQLLNLYVTENGQYEREDGWGTVTVDVPTEGSDCSEAYDKGFEDGYNQGQSECEEVDCSGAYEEGYDKGKNDGYDSGYQDGYNAGQPIKYNTIADIYGSPSDSTVNFKGLVALSFAYGSGYYILFTDHTGSILLRNHKEPLMVGDECVVTATLRRTDSSYISVLFTASVEVLSSNNYVVMPAEAVELTNVDELYMPNENGYAEMKYLYVDGKVIGSPREDFMRLETEASSKGNIGLRGDFKDWVEKLKEGDSIRVYMFTENSTNNFDVKDIVQLGTVGGSCNLEDKWVTPSMSERDDNGLIVVDQSEGYDGLDRVVIDPTTIYNEGIEEGRNQGGGSGDCNIQENKTVELDGDRMGIYPDEGYNGISEVIVEAGRKAEEWREEGRNDVRNKLQSIDITENGRYSADDTELIDYIEFDGNSYFDTNIPFGENTKIEVAITKTTYEEDEQFIGVAQFDLNTAEIYGGFGIVAGAGLTYGVFGKAKTDNIGFSYEEEQILTLDRNGLNSSLTGGGSWLDESGLDGGTIYGQTIGIGKIKSVSDGWIYRGLNGRIRYVKIWTDGNDDSTLVTFIPKNMEQGCFGLVNSDGIEYANISNLGEGTTTFISEWESKYGEGWREINVNVPSVDNYNHHILTAIGGVVDYGNVPFNVTTFRQKDYNITTFWGDQANAVIGNGNLSPNVLVHSLIVGVGYIGAYSFQNMKKLTDITIRPHTIGDYAFANCSNLNRITLYGFSTTAVDYFVSDTSFEGVADKGVVVLYDDNEEGETWVRDVFMTKLPSEWTIEIIKPK